MDCGRAAEEERGVFAEIYIGIGFVGYLSSVQELNISWNSFNGAIPSLDTTKLQKIDMSHNQLTRSVFTIYNSDIIKVG